MEIFSQRGNTSAIFDANRRLENAGNPASNVAVLGKYFRSSSRSTDVFQKNIPAFQ
jgi:hypothetical protein